MTCWQKPPVRRYCASGQTETVPNLDLPAMPEVHAGSHPSHWLRGQAGSALASQLGVALAVLILNLGMPWHQCACSHPQRRALVRHSPVQRG
ncbi:hypothetical protein N7510_007685 [Penicillium lagena]|uniref:uncharacterized protein n=1 Tax=Penicillium lagena TaxID=94218 RepID=UPI002540F4BC|nr:uncharacterized protein N7510_007685 [Penicillium lagena]KAJ5610966.1 hypothetical protein N7510_007685 [Penicillium lagena]